MHHFKLFSAGLVLTLTALIGCTKPTKGPDDSSGATFYVKSVNGSATTNLENHLVWKIPQSATFTFQGCLTSRASRKDLYNQDFAVEVPGSREVYPVTTNKNGCFDWQETIPYNHFAGQSGWVTVARDVVGRGVNLGRQHIKIAINPWTAGEKARDGGEAVVFMEAGERKFTPSKVFSVEHALEALSGELQGTSRLIVQNVKIKAIPEGEDGKWVALLVEVTMEPQVQALNANGQTAYETIKDGEFDLKIQVLASNVGAEMNQKILLLGGDLYAIGKSINGHLKAEFKVRQERRANQGNLELLMEISPRNLSAYKTLIPFDGLFRFGSGTTVQEQSGSLANMCNENSSNCNFNVIKESAANYQDLMGEGYVRDNERYIFSNLKLRFTSILPGETTTQRTVIYAAQTCITDNQTGKSLANTPMVIRYVRRDDGKVDMEPTEIKKSTDESGCLSWNGQQFHKYYEPEEFFEKEVIIQKGTKTIEVNGVATQIPSFERHLKYYLNPWDDKFTFGWDAREFTQEFFDDIRKRQKIRSRFFLSDYNYHTVRFLYNIDQYMELDVKKWVLMGLVPQVLRYSGIINARKMVERLRDGIYLMKVAIQKNYLDSRDNSGWLLRNTPEYQSEMVSIGGNQPIHAKEYITTNMVLVRVVDGVIIYPIELSMQDLRLMRVRSNLLIQLEMVDERLVQAYHVFKKYSILDQDLEQKLKEFKDMLEKSKSGDSLPEIRKKLGDLEVAPELKRFENDRNLMARSSDLSGARKGLEDRVNHIQDMIRDSVSRLKGRYESGKTLGVVIDSEGKPTNGSVNIQPGTMINENFEVREELFNELKGVLRTNDFSTVALPKKEEIDLNLFAEKNSGLEKRSFVGPVIFLSNAYSDSMRATDNLDEAGCADPIKGRDAMTRTLEELDLDYEGNKEIKKSEASLFGNRQNNAFQYSKYYNSLNHLCGKSVDDLMEKERELKANRKDVSRVASLKFNFVDNFNLDFVSLTDEPLLRIMPDCKGTVDACLQTTDERTIKSAGLQKMINDNLVKGVHLINLNGDNLIKVVRGIPFRAEKVEWRPDEYQDLFFKRSRDSRATLCNLLANKVAAELRDKRLSWVSAEVIHEKVVDICGMDGGLVHDIKLHVEQTGKYTFLGGLNLNFNVGEGFSVGTSSGYSAGFDMTDAVGAVSSLAGGKVASAILKPISLKYGTSLGSSEGTSISESTYLVSQIAGFDVELTAYERCAAVRLSDQTIRRMATSWGDSKIMRKIGLGTANFSDTNVIDAFKRGLFVCEGKTRESNKPITVPESYFYFTQHFTEGDMLDQADLYNHPWLLALRGQRDFAIFVEKIRAQELANLPEFLYHLAGTRDARPKGWALEHLGGAFHNLLPTFPGFYTMLDDGEGRIDVFALQQARRQFTKTDTDQLHEVNHPTLLIGR